MFFYPIQFLASAEAMERAWTPQESREYTRWLATHHYENFHVVSLLLPKRLHQDFYNVYSFCRWADDLGDEIGDPQESLLYVAEAKAMGSAACVIPPAGVAPPGSVSPRSIAIRSPLLEMRLQRRDSGPPR